MGGIYEIKKPRRINSFSVTIFLMAAAIGYLGYFFIPVWWPVFQLTGIMRGACNNAYREYDDKKVISVLLRDASRTKLRVTEDNFRLTRLPYTEEELAVLSKGQQTGMDLLRRRGKECVLEMRYQDDYKWPLIGTTTHLEFEREVRASLETIKWEKGCTCVTTSHR